MGSHRCCCPEDPGGQCDCDCTSGVCDECCWSPGDLVEYDHDWRGSFTWQKTVYRAFGFNTTHKCWQDSYEGGQVTVRYACVGCINCPVVEGIAYVFALLTAGKEAINADKIKGGKWIDDEFIYDLPNYLLLTCRTEDGFKHWMRSNTGTCGEGDIFELDRCVNPCFTGCQNVSYTPCDPDQPIGDGCADQGGIPVSSPDNFNCPNCSDMVEDCGGYRAYCAIRRVDQECVWSGNTAGIGANSGVCEVACEDELSSISWPLTTCTVKLMQTLTILPPANSDRNCRWFDEEDCCKQRKTSPTGGEDVTLPDLLSSPTIPDQSFPDDWSGNCDCQTNPQSAGECGPPGCPDDSGDTEKEVCL